jgi:uncharacterized protein
MMTKSFRSLAFALFFAGTTGSLVACRQEPPNITIHTTDKNVVEKNRMTVSGTATLQVNPDCADLVMTIEGKAMRPGAAVASLKKKQDALIANLRRLALEDADLKLSTMSIDPVYEWVENTNVFKGYVARLVLTATTRKFDLLGAMMEAGGDADVTQMSSQFRRSDIDDLKKKVREMALLAARDKARQITTTLGIELGKISAVIEDGASPFYERPYFAQVPNALEADAKTWASLGAELQPLTLNVSITYDLPDAA